MEGREVPAATSDINTITGIRNIVIKHSGLIIILWLICNENSTRDLEN